MTTRTPPDLRVRLIDYPESAVGRRDWSRANRDLEKLRARAAGASRSDVTEAANALIRTLAASSDDSTMSIIAMKARRLAMLADRITAETRLRAYEESLVSVGMATWIEET